MGYNIVKDCFGIDKVIVIQIDFVRSRQIKTSNLAIKSPITGLSHTYFFLRFIKKIAIITATSAISVTIHNVLELVEVVSAVSFSL